jgi:hypothetical protein
MFYLVDQAAVKMLFCARVYALIKLCSGRVEYKKVDPVCKFRRFSTIRLLLREQFARLETVFKSANYAGMVRGNSFEAASPSIFCRSR